MAVEFDEPLEDLAEAVLQGSPVDWASAESSAGAPSREAIRQLKVLAAIAELHRNLLLDQPDLARPKAAAEGPQRWGRLQILERIGRGAFGEVFRAWDSKLDREVAVKMLHSSGARPEGAAVLKEARLLARVRHPNVVTVYDADEFDGRVGLWMEFIHGKDLEEVLRERKRLDDREVIRIGIELCRALKAVHEAGLLHRDVKAQNLMQTADGRLILMDFGTGRELEHMPDAAADEAGALSDLAPEVFKTLPATVQAGTPLYLAPEVFQKAPATIRADIYSAGVLLFHLLTGEYPVFGTTVREVAEAHASGQRTNLATRAPRVTRTLAGVIGRALQPDPSERFESAADMLAALESVQRRTEAGRRKRSWLALGAVLLIAVALAFVPGVKRRLQGRDPKSKSAGAPYFGTSPEKREVQLPQITFPGAPSPDGRYFPYSDSGACNLAVYEFATGRSRTLTNTADGCNRNYAEESIVSADSSQIAYSWADGSCQCVQLRVIGVAGGDSRVLASSKEPNDIGLLEWSQDGSQILGWRRGASGGTEILLISTSDGSIRPVRTLNSGASHISLSPDGRYVAYDHAEDPGDTDRGIFLSATDGSEEIPVVTGPTYDTHPMWTPDGSGLVFASLRTGGPGIWLQPMKDGRAEGKPRLLDKDVGPFNPITLTRVGSLFYWHRTGLMDVYTVPIDPVSGDIQGEPTIVANRNLGSNIAPGWSPDGATLVFSSWRTLFGPGQKTLVFHSMETGVEREVEVLAGGDWPRYSSDGRSVFVWGRDRKGTNQLKLVDIESGKILGMYFMKPGDVPPVSAVGWGPDPRYAYLQRGLEKISRFDLQTGDEDVLYRPAPNDVLQQGAAVSPDGSSIAFSVFVRAEKRFRLFVLATASRTVRDLVVVDAPVRVGAAGWTRDGKQVLFVRTRTDETEHKQVGELWVVPFEGGPARSLGLAMPALRDVVVSPLGDRIAFTSGYPDQGIWVFENFLPRPASR